MIGAMPAVAVRHERRKVKSKDKNRPNRLMLKPHPGAQQGQKGGHHIEPDGTTLSPGGSHAPSANPSRAGSPNHHIDHNMVLGQSEDQGYYRLRYGDECFYGKVSLLHFIIFFFLGGLTVLIVGAVQFKKEAGLSYLRYHFLVAGAILVAVGVLLLIVKCACFRIPLPDEDYDEEFLSPMGVTATKVEPPGVFSSTPNTPAEVTTSLLPQAQNGGQQQSNGGSGDKNKNGSSPRHSKHDLDHIETVAMSPQHSENSKPLYP